MAADEDYVDQIVRAANHDLWRRRARRGMARQSEPRTRGAPADYRSARAADGLPDSLAPFGPSRQRPEN
jgi:hypothetical protein